MQGTVLAGFDEQVAARPDDLALASAGRSLSYRQLDERANQLAASLRERGVGPERVVGLCLRRNVDMAVAVLAVVKAGGAYLPLDPEYPQERLKVMVADADAVLVVTEGTVNREWAVPALAVDDPSVDAQPLAAGPCEAGPESLLYVIYTSGSTGRPKGIAMHHGPQITLLEWSRRAYAENPVALQYFPLTADVASLELFSAWWSGGSVVVAGDHDRYDVAATAGLIREHKVTKILLPVVAMQQLARHAVEHPEDVASLRELITTGDRLVITPEIRAMAATLPDVRFDDHYGSTEINVVSAPRLEQPAQDWPERPALGNPVAASRIYVLDAALRPTPKNVPGDIYVGGGPLGRGYLGQGALTAKAFLPDPFVDVAGARMYRTGDVGRWRSGGALEFLGRADFQVKIRGYRIEPGEIEALLREHEDVRQAVVVAVRAGEPDAALVAYVVGGDPDSLRDFLAERLPAHLMPQAFVVLDEFPLTTTGKIDRKQLPEPGAVEPPFVAPRDEIEELVAGIWTEVLGLGRIGVRHDFFSLGGHSMLVTRVVYQLNRSLGINLPLRTVFDRPTIEGLAAAARELQA